MRFEVDADFGVFDIESTNIMVTDNQKFILAGFKIGDNYQTFDSPNELLASFVSYPDKCFYAHNLGYDIRFLFDLINEFCKMEMIFANSKLIKLVAYDKKKNVKLFELRDSLAVLPRSLDFLAKTFGNSYLKKMDFIDFDIEEFNSNNPYHLEYLKNDVYALEEILNCFFNRFNVNKNKLTISSMSFDKWRESYDMNKKVFTYRETYPDLRCAYYGGRVEIFNHLMSDGFYYDVNSLYPFVMSEREYPVNNYDLLDKVDRDYIDNSLGIYLCKVKIDNLDIPLLPYRTMDKLIFPVGEFSGWFTSAEIEKAIKLGYDVEFIRGYVWFQSDFIFKKYIDDYYKFKLKAEENNDKCGKFIAKLFLNSLSGKFGQKQNRESIVYMSDEERKQFFINNPKGELNNFHSDYVLRKNDVFIKNYAVQVSAFITSYARLELYSYLEKLGIDNIYYCDTDSVFTTELLKTGKNLGEMKEKAEIVEAVFLAPKMYGYVNSDYEVKIKSKGFNVMDRSYNEIKNAFLKNEAIVEKRVIPTSIKMSNYRKLNVTSCYEQIKRYSKENNETKRILNEDGKTTRPIRVLE